MTDTTPTYDALSALELEFEARQRQSETASYQGILANKYRRWHHYYAPLNGDQWPEDRMLRPGMIHITHNIIQPAVDVESRIESRLPRVTLLADNTADPVERTKAEAAEKLVLRWLEQSSWQTWLNDACKVKSMYGKTVLKPYWNSKAKPGRPDVSVIESPHNLYLGWGSSEYDTIDWALYEYSISPFEAMRKYKNITVSPPSRTNKSLSVVRHADHADPLNQKGAGTSALGQQGGSQLPGGHVSRIDFVQPSDYEGKQVRVWDYWCKHLDDAGAEHIVNAVFVEGVLADGPYTHDEYPDIPYIVIEHDHEPNSPEGMGDVEGLIDTQVELNRALSHWAQLIADEIDPAWQINADSVPGGMAPKGGQITAAGEGKEIKPFEKSVNQFPIQALVDEFKKDFFFRSGLSDILFTQAPGAQTAGRALQVQIEAVANRIDPRRDNLYAGLKTLLVFWTHMAKKVNPQIKVAQDADGNDIFAGPKDLLGDFTRWKFVAPEITPRDNLESITAVVNKLNAKLISLEDAMDELGVDSPLEMIQKIEAERTNPKLFAGDTQAYVAVLNMLLQLQATQQQMGMQPGVPGAPGAPGGPGDPNAQAQQDAQNAQPQGTQGDNGSGVPQPATAAGGPPPPGAPGPGGVQPGGIAARIQPAAPGFQNQTLIRANPTGGASALQQIKVVTGG